MKLITRLLYIILRISCHRATVKKMPYLYCHKYSVHTVFSRKTLDMLVYLAVFENKFNSLKYVPLSFIIKVYTICSDFI